MADYYDRAGRRIDTLTWARMFEDVNAKVVDRTTVGDADVSTVWLGIDHSFGEGPPLIFETMVFDAPPDQDNWQARCSTEEQAREGHAAVVAWLRGEGPEPDA